MQSPGRERTSFENADAPAGLNNLVQVLDSYVGPTRLAPSEEGGDLNRHELAFLCNGSFMKHLIAPVALVGILVLSACGGESQADASVERQAGSSETFTLCVKNDSSRTISSTGDGSPSQPDGFIVRPGENDCTTTAPGTRAITQSMMSDVGPSWTTSYVLQFKSTPVGTLPSTDFSICGRTWSDETSISASLSCSGNPFRISVNFNSTRADATANVTFADR